MSCNVSRQQLWSWIDGQAPELERHLAECASCRALAAEFRTGMQQIAIGSTPLSIPLPERIGTYTVKRLLGEGGQALVYEAEQQNPRRLVALKVLKGGRCVSEHQVRHIEREAQALARLDHPGIATIHDAGRTPEGLPYFAMQLVTGLPLDEYVHKNGLPLNARLELFARICDAVEYAHQRGVIHRDLKPSNILVDAQGNPKILDFGLSRVTGAEATLTATVTGGPHVEGTLRYMSPEAAHGEPDGIDPRTDVFSLGVILYEIVTDQPPFDVRAHRPETLSKIWQTPARPPSRVRPSLGGRFDVIVLTALEVDRARRYGTAGALGEDVRRYLRREPLRARRLTVFHRTRKLVARRPATSAALVALAVLASAAWLVIRWRNTRDLMSDRLAAARIQNELEAGRLRDSVAAAENLFGQSNLPEAKLVRAQALFRLSQEHRDAVLLARAAGTLRDGLTETTPSNWAFCALLAELERQQGHHEEALRLDACATGAMPDTPQACYLRTFATLNLRSAWDYARRAVNQATDSQLRVLAWKRAAYLSLLVGDFEEARRAAQQLRLIGYDEYECLTLQGIAFSLEGRYVEAADPLERAIRAMPNESLGYVHLAVAHLCEKNYAAALRAYERSSEFEHGYWLRYKLATPLWMTGRLDRAAEEYRQFRHNYTGPSYASVRLFLVLRERARQLDEEGDPVHAESARREAAQVLADGCRSAGAGTWLEKIHLCLAGESSPDALVGAADSPCHRCEGYYYAGEACWLQRQSISACAWFEKCALTNMIFDPDSPDWDPMNEYHLAIWRLDRLRGEERTTSAPGDG